ncbi:hypothetical protein AMECASPLE_035003 [Ameca splendens]|uniref:Uncharacterized protein n=1 Tax=Ameca splendens TaxID=208324 RepID=A0ABV0Y752_9TELE
MSKVCFRLVGLHDYRVSPGSQFDIYEIFISSIEYESMCVCLCVCLNYTHTLTQAHTCRSVLRTSAEVWTSPDLSRCLCRWCEKDVADEIQMEKKNKLERMRISFGKRGSNWEKKEENETYVDI